MYQLSLNQEWAIFEICFDWNRTAGSGALFQAQPAFEVP
jgi:hypothetical protein